MNPYLLICNKSGEIVNCTTNLLEKLQYNFHTLEGQFIGILMNDFMSMLHKKYYIKMFNKVQGVERNRMENKLKNLHHKRTLIIYDINKDAHYVSVSVEPITTVDHLEGLYRPIEFLTGLLIIKFEFLEGDISLFNIRPNVCDTDFKLNKSDTVIIMTDFIRSTELLHEKGAITAIDTTIRFYSIVTNLIRTKYYPFIYLHENIGDCFVLALNTDWTYNTDMFCSTLAINFIFDLIQATRGFIQIRTGIGYGKIYYGMIGTAFTFFGFPMNIAARLENKCNEMEINFCKKFFDKLVNELDILYTSDLKKAIVHTSSSLKGFGETNYYTIKVSEDVPYLLYT